MSVSGTLRVFTVPRGKVGSKVGRKAEDERSLKRNTPHTLTPYPKRLCSERSDYKQSDPELEKLLCKETQCEDGIDIAGEFYPMEDTGTYSKHTLDHIKANVEKTLATLTKTK